MLDSALTFFQQQLNSYIQLKTDGQKENVVQFPEIQLPKELIMQSNAITALLVNLEEERTFRSGAAYVHQLPGGRNIPANPNLCLNFHLMFVANFKQYEESLQLLSLILQFFHSSRLFERQRFPSLGPDIEQLSTELVNLSFMEQGELWRSLEMPSSPSALYKVRMLIFHDSAMSTAAIDNTIQTVQVTSTQQ